VVDETERIPPDWRLVWDDQAWALDAGYVKERGIEAAGVIYLVDLNLHVHICSFTPNLEAWPVQPWATFKTLDHAALDGGETEQELMSTEETVAYVGTDFPSKRRTEAADRYVSLPGREEYETDEEYRRACAETVLEYLNGNPIE
jgi:hypothetical protein